MERFEVPKAEEDNAQNTQTVFVTMKESPYIVTIKESPYNELIRRTDDREGWKAMITDVCNRPGTR